MPDRSTVSACLAHPLLDHFEYCRVNRPLELHPGLPVLDPADPPLKGFDSRQRNPNLILGRYSHREFDAASLWREVENIDAPATLACPSKINVCTKRNPLRATPMVRNGCSPYPS